ncbi:MAG TPA: response regulator [Candidatus Thermoplasmatota archaeon]|nr:response regulator [Candidatus Thermoplasmatota archaeon]
MSEPRRRVLLVDDEAPILQATRDLLREYDYEVETHDDPASIHEKVRAMRPHAILQDVRMPGLDVRALVARLRADEATRQTRVILFSASIEATELARELDVPLVQKPFKPKALLAALDAE